MHWPPEQLQPAVRRRGGRLALLLCSLMALRAGLAPLGGASAVGSQGKGTQARTQAQVDDGTFAMDQTSGKVYLTYAGVKHLVATPATLAALGVAQNSVTSVSTDALASLATGPPLEVRRVQGQPWPFSTIASGKPTLFINPPAAASGAVVSVSGSGFGALEVVRIRWAHGQGALDVQADAAGHFSATLVLGPGQPLDIVLIFAYGATSGALAVQPFTLIPAAPASTLSALPLLAPPGGLVRLSGSGFAPGEPVAVFFDTGQAMAIGSADAVGSFRNLPLTIPGLASSGGHWTVAYGLTSKRTASVTLTVGGTPLTPTQTPGPRLGVDPIAVEAGATVTIQGMGFVPHDRVTLLLAALPIQVAVADAGGAFTLTWRLPFTTTPGGYLISARSSMDSNTTQAPLTVIAGDPRLWVSAPRAAVGSQLTLDGSGFAPSEGVTVALNGVQAPGSDVTADASGAFTTRLTVPDDAFDGLNAITAVGRRSRTITAADLTVTLATASTWYFAGTDPASQTVQLALVNTHEQAAHAEVTYFLAGKAALMTTTLSLRPRSRSTVNVTAAVGAGHAVGLKVTADQTIGAALTLLRPGRDFAMMAGTNAPHRAWYLAEGYTGRHFKETIFMLNPTVGTARVRVRLLPLSGHTPKTFTLTVAPLSTTAITVADYLPNQAASAIVEASQPIVVTRAEEFGPQGYGLTTRAGATQPSALWLFAEGSTANGFQTYLSVLNPSDHLTATVTASFANPNGTPLGPTTLAVAPLSRMTIGVAALARAGEVATVMTSTIPIVAERSLYFGPLTSARVGGSTVVGRNGGSPRWLFPEGRSGQGYTEFLALQNLGATAARVEATFYQADGTVVSTRFTVPSWGRLTVNTAHAAPGLKPGPHSVALRSLDGTPFVAEQSLYSDGLRQGDTSEGIAQ